MTVNQEMVGGKARGLLRLSEIEGLSIPPFTIIPANSDLGEVRQLVSAFLQANPLLETVAVRSSALCEDGEQASFAGAFQTILDVPAAVPHIQEAVQNIQDHGVRKLRDVFEQADNTNPSIGIVIQKMVRNPDVAGVCLSHGYAGHETSYALVNFKKGLGDELVGGEDSGTELRIARDGRPSPITIKKYPFLIPLMENLKKIEKVHGDMPVDIEFAYKDGELYILQARPFVSLHKLSSSHDLKNHIDSAYEDLARLTKNDLLGDMIDINPRELLGEAPEPVNVSLFRGMFADQIVERVRGQMGYAPLHMGLLKEIHGKPYVSLRAAAYSMRPEGISDSTYEKMYGIYHHQIKNNPDLQDKAEFDVFITNSDQVGPFLKKNPGVFNDAEQTEIYEAFHNIDTRIARESEDFVQNFEKTLAAYRLKCSGLSDTSSQNDVLEILQDGTSLFVKTARLAFYKKAAFETKYGSEKANDVLAHLGTPSDLLQTSLLRYASGQVHLDELESEYGHLRAGQMDIYSPPYRANLERNLNLPFYQEMGAEKARQKECEIICGGQAFRSKMNDFHPEHRKDIEELRTLIGAREHVKHEFMKAYDRMAILLQKSYPQPRHGHSPIILPSVLHKETDFACVEFPTGHGTFFSHRVVEAPVYILDDKKLHTTRPEDVKGKIIVADHADPGYDFILLYEPAAIITRIGGPASHIAIRVNERGLPAYIGSGIDPCEFDETRMYTLDCRKKQILIGPSILNKPVCADAPCPA